jgi:hypothetical protein
MEKLNISFDRTREKIARDYYLASGQGNSSPNPATLARIDEEEISKRHERQASTFVKQQRDLLTKAAEALRESLAWADHMAAKGNPPMQTWVVPSRSVLADLDAAMGKEDGR